MKKVFFAIFFEPDINKELIRVIHVLKKQKPHHDNLRWKPEDKLHLTLRYVGHVNDEQLSNLIVSTEQALAGITPFKMRFLNISRFPPIRPRMIVANMALGIHLANMRDLLNQCLALCGFQTDHHGFLPHVTLASSKHLFSAPFIYRSVQPNFKAVNVSSIALMESIQEGSSTRYQSLKRFSFRSR